MYIKECHVFTILALEKKMNGEVFTHKDFGDAFIKDYLDLFETYSIGNENYGRISMHVILGQSLKNVYYMLGAREIDIRLHMLLIQSQGSGKGAGFGFCENMSQFLGLDFKSYSDETGAGLAGTKEWDATEKQNVVVDGVLKTADIVGKEEASSLFDYTNEHSKMNLIYMQQTMNNLKDASCHIGRKLGGIEIDFKPHASFLLMTYPPDKLVDKLLKTGFIDRMITIFQEVTLKDRLEVIRKMKDMINSSDKLSNAEKFNSVAKRMKIVVDKFSKQPVKVVIPETVHDSLLQIIDELAMKILDASPKARDKLEHFVSRLYETLIKLSIHHALLSLRSNVTVGDVLYARLIYTPIWENLIISIESLLIISPEERHRKNTVILRSVEEYDRLLKEKKFVKEDGWVRRPTLIKNLQVKWDNCSVPTADSNLSKIEKIPGMEKYDKLFTKITEYEKDKIFERKYFGDVAYVKKIKEIY
jgi:hypothetical protein